MNNLVIRRFLLVLCMFYSASSHAMLAKLAKIYHWGKSVVIAQADSLLGAHYHRAFNFHRFAADECRNNVISHNGVAIELFQEKIIALNDGKKVPLFLGNIPHQQFHFDGLKAMALATSGQESVEIMSMNVKLERDKLGLSKLIDENSKAHLFKYPTIDITPPSLIDLIRIVRDLERRDARNAGLVFVHCRAGAGRSPVAVAAYLVNVLHGAGFNVSPDQILNYLSMRRHQVDLTLEQRGAVHGFYAALIAAGNFENLSAVHKEAIDLRDQEMANL